MTSQALEPPAVSDVGLKHGLEVLKEQGSEFLLAALPCILCAVHCLPSTAGYLINAAFFTLRNSGGSSRLRLMSHDHGVISTT